MRLSNDSLSSMSVRIPNYDRDEVTTGIIHLGIGAFHRAHQAVYVDDLLAQDPRWGIVGASLQSPQTARALNPQDGLYTVITKGGNEPQLRVIGSISRVICAKPDGEGLIEHMTTPSIKIVSLTITEKGYCHVPATGLLDIDNKDIQYDAKNPTKPRTAPGFLVAALRERRKQGIRSFSILSCDNLPQNGTVARNVVIGLARLQDTTLASWIEKNTTFPGTMVDRIVPATTNEEVALVKNKTGIDDASPVVTEPFCQWVIEDDFCAGKPAFEKAGAVLTKSVDSFEKMKLRLLNGSHSALAYIGLLRGHHTIAEAIQDPEIYSFVHSMMEQEISSTLTIPKGVDLHAYRTALLTRFANTELKHSLIQIASDGSQKLPQRILDPIRDRLKAKQPIILLAQVITAWLRFISSHDGKEYLFSLNDPLANELRECIEQSKPSKYGLPLELLYRRDIFGDDLSVNQEFHSAVDSDSSIHAQYSNRQRLNPE